MCICISVSFASATTRTQNAIDRAKNATTSVQSTRSNNSINRAAVSTKNISSRTINKTNNVNYSDRTKTSKSRSAKSTPQKVILNRSATRTPSYQQKSRSSIISRAASTQQTNAFDENYTNCQGAYFSCMDQFCATVNETYRRCICSSKLKNVQQKESKISQTKDQLQDFKNVNIDAISKTAAEVTAMSSASEGEAAIKKDKSSSSLQLQNITEILDKTKQDKSTQSSSNINSDIKSIWSTTDLIGGADISTLTGESLYNAVHAQCIVAVKDACVNEANLKMVTSAYGMYIENDCSLLDSSLKKQITETNTAINATKHEMQDTRLENYNAHNSLSINDCIAKVRQDLTKDTACGENFVHCLDITGKYLNSTTGEPLYTTEFYQLSSVLSMDGDILQNKTNQEFVATLNKKRSFAEQSLDLCRNKSEHVWQEFLRQALVEIYQTQLKTVQKVKQECLQVVNQCYSDKSASLSDFGAQASLTQRILLTEDMCTEKLNACGNLYSKYDTSGIQTLIQKTNDLTIEQACHDLLKKYLASLCTPTTSEALPYPYNCSSFIPGDLFYAKTPICNQYTAVPGEDTQIQTSPLKESEKTETYYKQTTAAVKKYRSCRPGYTLAQKDASGSFTDTKSTTCTPCPIEDYTCVGGTSLPVRKGSSITKNCGTGYIGSLLQKMVIYALQNCSRNSTVSDDTTISDTLLSDIGVIFLELKTTMTTVLSKICTDQGGIWITKPFSATGTTSEQQALYDSLSTYFYNNNRANKAWGYCIKAE